MAAASPKFVRKFCNHFVVGKTAHGSTTDVILVLRILHSALPISKAVSEIYSRVATASVCLAQVFRIPGSINVLAEEGYNTAFQSSKWATLLSDACSVTSFKLQRPPAPARYRNRLFL
jgi:hypothetical protein